MAAKPASAWEWAVSLLGLAVSLVFTGVALALVLVRPSVMTWCLYWYAVGFFSTAAPLSFYNTLPEPLYVVLSFILATVLGNIVVMPLIPFVLRFPGGWLERWEKPADRIAWIAIALAYVAYVAEFVHLRTTGDRYPWSGVLDEWLPLAVFGAAAAIMIKSFGEMHPAARQRTGYFFIGGIASFIAYAVYFVPGVDPVVQSVVSDLVVIFPITVAYAVLKHRVLDINFVLNRAIAYAVLSVLVVVVVTLIDWASSQVVSHAHFATMLEIAVTIGVGFFLTKINRLFEQTIDVVVFRRRHLAERYLSRVADALPYATKEEAITDGLVIEPVRALELAAGALYRRSEDGERFVGVATSSDTLVAPMGFDRNHTLVRFLQSSEDLVWLDDVRGQLDPQTSAIYVLAMPVTVRHELAAFVLYGAHSNGTQIDPDECSLLKSLAREAARAYDHVEAVRTRELLARFMAVPARTP